MERISYAALVTRSEIISYGRITSSRFMKLQMPVATSLSFSAPSAISRRHIHSRHRLPSHLICSYFKYKIDNHWYSTWRYQDQHHHQDLRRHFPGCLYFILHFPSHCIQTWLLLSFVLLTEGRQT